MTDMLKDIERPKHIKTYQNITFAFSSLITFSRQPRLVPFSAMTPVVAVASSARARWAAGFPRQPCKPARGLDNGKTSCWVLKFGINVRDETDCCFRKVRCGADVVSRFRPKEPLEADYIDIFKSRKGFPRFFTEIIYIYIIYIIYDMI